MLTINELTPEARELLKIFRMSGEEQIKILETAEEQLTYEATGELLTGIIKDTHDFADSSNEDRILWIVRQSYLAGFAQAMDIILSAFELKIREEAEL